MSLESFFGLDDVDSSGSAEASEKFREQMRKNAKALKGITAHQQKQKKQEDKLAKLMVRFIQDPNKGGIVFLMVRLLQANIPGAFILAIVAITDPQLKKELTALLAEEKIKLPEGQSSQIIEIGGDGVLPEAIRSEINVWGMSILHAGLLLPNKTLNTVLTPDHKLKSIVLDLLDYSLSTFFRMKGMDFPADKVRQVALISIQSVLIRLRDTAQSQTDAEIIETASINQTEDEQN